MNTTRRDQILAGLCILLAGAYFPGAGAEVVYQEDWEGGADGLSVTSPPYNWTPDGGDNAGVSDDTPFGPATLAFDGDTANTSGNVNFWHDVPSPLDGESNYVLTAQAWVGRATAPETAGSGAGRAYVGLRNSDSGDYVVMFWQGAQGTTTPNEWRFITWIDGSSSQFSFTSGAGTNEIVDLTVRLDLVAGMAYGVLEHSGGTETNSKAIDASFLAGMNTVALFSDILNGSPQEGALKVDNILVERSLADVSYTEVEMDDALVLHFQSGTGERYRLQALSSPTTESWADTGLTVDGNGYEMVILEPPTPGIQKLYRLERVD